MVSQTKFYIYIELERENLPIAFYGGCGIIIIVKGEGQRTS